MAHPLDPVRHEGLHEDQPEGVTHHRHAVEQRGYSALRVAGEVLVELHVEVDRQGGDDEGQHHDAVQHPVIRLDRRGVGDHPLPGQEEVPDPENGVDHRDDREHAARTLDEQGAQHRPEGDAQVAGGVAGRDQPGPLLRVGSVYQVAAVRR